MDKSYFFDRFVMRRNYRELIIVLEEGDKKIKELAEYSGMAYQHLCAVMQEAQKEGIIVSKRKDNALNFNLTEKGKAINALCLGLKMCIENWDGETTISNLNKLSFVNKVDLNVKEEQEGSPASESVIKPPTGKGEKDYGYHQITKGEVKIGGTDKTRTDGAK